MKPNVLLTIAAIYLALVGLGLLLVPDTMTLGALGASAPAILVGTLRGYGGALIAIAVLNWFARNADASKARDAIMLGNTVGFGLNTVTVVLGVVSGAPASGWLFAIIGASSPLRSLSLGAQTCRPARVEFCCSTNTPDIRRTTRIASCCCGDCREV